ncbi:MAG: YihA family ribosome biogenesis GTP-binding protein [Gammaproteobacteria bacterium]|nr:MAG: YihA family ribosome biogenesis GTP-binding protein [Gammaproteobacteria bacterium]
MNPRYRQARFLTSAARLSQAPPDEGREIAFAGRSNAGKSSAINALCDQQGLARTSRTPGRTQLLNFFEIEPGRRLVDLPGYGYAKVAERVKRDWQGTLAEYLERRRCLRGLVLVMDARHPLKPYDQQMLAWANQIPLPVHVLLTKADKLNRQQSEAALAGVQEALRAFSTDFTAQIFSATRRWGIDEAHAQLDQWLGPSISPRR